MPFDDIEGESMYLEDAGRDEGAGIKAKPLNVQVWIYSRANNKIYDVSAFIKNVITNKDFGAGTFTLVSFRFHN